MHGISRFLLAILAVAAAGRGSAAAEGPGSTLIVRVVDRSTGEPVPYATVVLSNGERFSGNRDGRIVVRGASSPSISFHVEHVAFEPSATRTEHLEGAESSANVELTPRAHPLPAVLVSGDRAASARELLRGSRQMSAADGQSLPNPSEDLFELVRVLPGVSSDDVGGQFRLQGGSTDETLVRIDGLEVSQLFHGREFGGIAGVIPLQSVQSIEVYPAGFAAEYGGKLSGVVDVRLRSSGPKGFQGRVGADLISSRALAELHDEKRSFVVSAREGHFGHALSLRSSSTIEPTFRDFLVRTVLHPDDRRELSINYLRIEDHTFFDDGIPAHGVNDDYVEHHVWTTGRLRPVERFSVAGTIFRSRSRQLRELGESDHESQWIDRAGGRFEADLATRAGHSVKAGIEIDREWGKLDLESDEVVTVNVVGQSVRVENFSTIGDFSQLRAAAFLQDDWQPLRWLALNAGARVTHESGLGSLRADPRFAGTLRAPGGVVVRAAWGLYEQPPSIAFEGDVAMRLRSGRPERAEHRVLSLEKRAGSSRFGLDAYDKRLHELNGIVTRTRTGDLHWEVMTHGRAKGLEAHWTRNTASSDLWMSYALGRSEWGNDRWVFARKFDKLHTISLANVHRIGGSWELGWAYSFHTGLPYTVQNWSRDPSTRKWTLDEGIPQRERLPSYHRFDVRLKRQFQFEGWNLAVYAEALNVTNHDNVLWYAWSFREENGTRLPVRIPRHGVPGVPSLGLEASF
jgi:hypothetical protein